MSNESLVQAKKAKNDEFYTRYEDVEAELMTYYNHDKNVFRNKIILCPCDDSEYSNFVKFFVNHFTHFGIKKLIATCYNQNGHGKLLIMTNQQIINTMFDGNGDFRSKEVTRWKEQADMIITNPPFSLFGVFLKWIGNKEFSVVGSMNVISYVKVFPLIKANKIWLGANEPNKFVQPDGSIKRFGNICWFTNIDFDNRNEPLQLHTMEYNLRNNKSLQKKLAKYGVDFYPQYDYYNAIEVPMVKCIPSDYNGIMGVPITFLTKYNPNQFEIIGLERFVVPKKLLQGGRFTIKDKKIYARILIRYL